MAYWYTSSFQNVDEPDPAGTQYVDYAPPFGAGTSELTPGRYLVNAEYRVDANRASYDAEYIVTHPYGVTTILRSQLQGASANFDLGIFDLDAGSGYVVPTIRVRARLRSIA